MKKIFPRTKISYLIFLYNVLAEKPFLGRKKQCVNKKKLSDSNPDEMTSRTFVTSDGTSSESICSGSCMSGRIAKHNVFKEKVLIPTSYAKRNIENGYAISAWRLPLEESMLRHIKNCTDEEAHCRLGKNEWSTTLGELAAVISILYARGIYGANNLESDILWSVFWCRPFFRDTMARDRFRELMKFLRFD